MVRAGVVAASAPPSVGPPGDFYPSPSPSHLEAAMYHIAKMSPTDRHSIAVAIPNISIPPSTAPPATVPAATTPSLHPTLGLGVAVVDPSLPSPQAPLASPSPREDETMLGQGVEIVALMEGPPSPGNAQVCASPLYPQHALSTQS
eukprot:5593351-Prorocentrum_lima.AAC.1